MRKDNANIVERDGIRIRSRTLREVAGTHSMQYTRFQEKGSKFRRRTMGAQWPVSTT